MKQFITNPNRLLYILLVFTISSCRNSSSSPSTDAIKQLNLKKGPVISCGAGDQPFGLVDFEMSCDEKAKKDFNLAMELLHSFEYDEAEKVFAKVIDETPGCAMAYWGVAMSNFHPLWNPPTEAELVKGSKAIEIATGITKKSGRESLYINAAAAFYKDWSKTGHHNRCLNFEKAMEKLHNEYPADKEAAIFYALALDASAEPTDKTYANQKKAAAILNTLYASETGHPGIVHYIIHTYDYPGLAEFALPAARKYAQVAPSSAHALHMPSHIFTRLGLWDECIKSNLESVGAAQCYAEQAGLKGHWDEEMHGLDYLVYAYLQKGENKLANEQLKYLDNIKNVSPVNFKVAYAFAAIPSRIFLENKKWKEAAALQTYPADLPWINFPWQEAIMHFTRLLGAAHLGHINEANTELAKLNVLRQSLDQQKDIYKSQQVATQIKTGEAWILLANGKTDEALNALKIAADMEDGTEKHPVTPGAVLPAREQLGDMLLQLKQYQNALQAYEAVLQKCPKRFNSLYGAGLAAEKSGNRQKTIFYYKQLSLMNGTGNSDRHEFADVQKFLAMQ